MALYDLCSIFHLTFYDENMRKAAERLRELIRVNTLGELNKCDFDMNEQDKKRAIINQRNDPK